MPELPEVETVVRGLQTTITGETIVDIEVPWEKALNPDDAYDSLVGKTIVGVSRRAKFIIIQLDVGTLVVHLRMTGKLTPVFPEKYITDTLPFRSGNALYFPDMPQCGRPVRNVTPAHAIGHLGP